MIESTTKAKYFEYFVHRLYENLGKGDLNDLSRLKSIKLLFFTTAVRANPKSPSVLINEVFDNFHALPYGHVESNVFDAILNEESLKFYNVTKNGATRKDNFTAQSLAEFIASLDQKYLTEIDKSIAELSRYNPSIFKCSAFYLVDLSHQWYSWKKNFRLAQNDHKSGRPIDKDDIINENKFFSLQF